MVALENTHHNRNTSEVMLLPFWFIYIAAGLRMLGGVGYLMAVIRGRAQPNPLSWLLWSITPLIAFAAEVSAGVGLSSIVTLALGFSPLLVFITTMIKNPKAFKLDALNILCACIALGGIALWAATDSPLLAITFAVVADIFSCLPTLRKIVKRPYSEYAPTYAISAFSMMLTLLALQQVSFASVAFPLYVLCINSFIVLFIYWSQKRRLA